MKEWKCWTLLGLGVIVISIIAWKVAMSVSIMTSIYITILLNGIVMCYNMIEFGGKKKQR